MTINNLQRTVDEIKEHLRVVTDLRTRVYESKGAYSDLKEIGLDTIPIYRGALALEEILSYQLNVASQTLKLLETVEALKNEEWLEENRSK